MSAHPDPPRSGRLAHWKRDLILIAAAAALSLLLFSIFTFYGLQHAPVNTANTPVTTDDLMAAYMDNPGHADSMYANKTYYVTGVPISMQQDQRTGQYYSDFVLTGFIQFYWKDPSQASRVVPCAADLCQPILAKCFLAGFEVQTAGSKVIMMNDCEFIR